MSFSKLGAVAQYLRGINFKPDDVVAVGTAGTVACMRTKNIQESLDCSDVWGVAETFVRRPEQILQEGDILVSSANSWNLVGKCCWIPELPWKSTFGGFVSALRAKPNQVDPRFLYWWFSSDRTQALLRSFGQKTTSISNLNSERCLNLDVPLPPLPDQRRIAAILDQADALRAKRREALAQLDSLTQSIFIEMFGDISISPKFNLGSIRAFVDANSGKSAKSVLSAERTDIPIYGGNGINGWATNALYEHPVLIFGRVGQQCGNAFMTEGSSWVTDNAIVVQISDSSKLNPVFVLHAFQGSNFSNRVKHLDLPFINQGMILDNPIPIPPLIVQQTFANRIQTVEALKVSHRASVTELDILFASLQHRAFRGEL